MNKEEMSRRAIEHVVLSLLHQKLRPDAFPVEGRVDTRMDGRRRYNTEAPGPQGGKFSVMWEDGTQEVVYGARGMILLELGFIDNLFGKKKDGARWKMAPIEHFQGNADRWRRGKYMETKYGVVAFVRREN